MITASSVSLVRDKIVGKINAHMKSWLRGLWNNARLSYRQLFLLKVKENNHIFKWIFCLETIYIMSVNGWICVSAVKKMLHEMALFAVICMIVWIKYLNDSFSFIFKTGWPFLFFLTVKREDTQTVFWRGSINDLNSRCKFTIKHN